MHSQYELWRSGHMPGFLFLIYVKSLKDHDEMLCLFVCYIVIIRAMKSKITTFHYRKTRNSSETLEPNHYTSVIFTSIFFCQLPIMLLPQHLFLKLLHLVFFVQILQYYQKRRKFQKDYPCLWLCSAGLCQYIACCYQHGNLTQLANEML